MQNNIQDVLVWKYKGNNFSCGETYDSLAWDSENDIPKPTLQDVEQADIEYSNYLPKKEIKRQILILEQSITSRRLREAVLTEEGRAWLENLNQNIDDLRSQL